MNKKIALISKCNNSYVILKNLIDSIDLKDYFTVLKNTDLIKNCSKKIKIEKKSKIYFSFTDTGGLLKIGKLDNKFLPNDPRFYECLEENTFIRFLTHPGNYFYNKPYMIKMKNI